MPNRMLHLFWLCAVALCLLGCTEQPQHPLKVATNDWLGYRPLYLAQDLGVLPAEQFHLVELDSSREGMRAFRNRDVDLVCVTLDEALQLRLTENEARIILVMDISQGGDLVMARPGIDKIADLRGKRVGVEAGALGAYMLARLLEEAGLTVADIIKVPYSYSETEDLYRQGKVDALITFQPMGVALEKLGARVIFDSRRLPGEIVDVLVARNAVLQQHPERIDRLLQGWFHVLTLQQQQPRKFIAGIEAFSQLEVDEAQVVMTGIAFPDAENNLHLLSRVLPEQMQRMAHIMLANGILGRRPDTSEFIDMAPLQRVAQ